MTTNKKNLAVPVLLLLVALATVVAVFLLQPGEEEVHHPGITVLLPDDELSAVELYDGMVWAGGRDGLYRVHPETRQTEKLVAPEDIPEFQYVKALLALEDTLWVGYEGGVATLRGGVWSATDRLPDLRVNALCADPESGVWAGTFGGAVHFTPELEPVETLTSAEGLRIDMVNAIATASDGSLWFGSFLEGRGQGGLSIRSQDGSWQLIGVEQGLPHYDITSIVALGDEMLVGCGMLNRGGGAVLARDPSGWQVTQTFSVDTGLAGEKVRSIFLRGDEIWFCSESDGIAVWRSGTRVALLTKEQGLSDNEVKDIACGEDGTLYLGSRYGLTELAPEAIARLLP